MILHAVEEGAAVARVGCRGGDTERFEMGFGVGERQVEVVEQPLPAFAHRSDGVQRRLPLVADEHGVVEVGVAAVQRQVAGEELGEGVAQGQLVIDRQFDIDALDAVAIVAHARQRNDDVLVELEGVGVARDGGGARAVEPELLARVGIDGDEAFGRASVAHPYDFRRGGHHRRIVVADQIADQHHLWAPGFLALALGLGGVADGLHVALVEVFEAGEQHAGGVAGTARLEVVGDLDDRRHGVAHLPVELETDGARVRRHPVQHPARGDDQAVGAFLLDARQAGEELVGDVLAEAGLAEGATRNLESLDLAAQCLAVRFETPDLEADQRLLVDLAEVVADARHFHDVTIDVDHLPPRQIVERRTPQHGLLAARVHRNIAADARSVGRGRVDGEDETGVAGRFGNPVGDDAGAGADRRVGLVATRQAQLLDRADVDQLLGVDDDGHRRQRHGAAGVTGAAAARDDRQSELDAAAHQRRDLVLGVGIEHDEGVLDAPVRRVGHVRDARQPVEGDVVAPRVTHKRLQYPLAQLGRRREMALEGIDRRTGRLVQPEHRVVALPALVDLVQAVPQRGDQRVASLAIGQEVVFQIRVALHDPDVAQHFVKHPRRPPGDALTAQLVEDRPVFRTEQANDDLAVGKRGVVVGDFAQTGVHGASGACKGGILTDCHAATRRRAVAALESFARRTRIAAGPERCRCDPTLRRHEPPAGRSMTLT